MEGSGSGPARPPWMVLFHSLSFLPPPAFIVGVVRLMRDGWMGGRVDGRLPGSTSAGPRN